MSDVGSGASLIVKGTVKNVTGGGITITGEDSKEYTSSAVGFKVGDEVTFDTTPWGNRVINVKLAPQPPKVTPVRVEPPKPIPVRVEPPKVPSEKADTVTPQVVTCQEVQLKLKVIVKDGLTKEVIKDADVKLDGKAPAKKTDKDGVVTFEVKQNTSHTVKAEKLKYSRSKRAPHDEATVEVADTDPADQTLYLTVTDKILIIGEGTDHGYAKALANRYSAAAKLKQVISTQYPPSLVTARPPTATANLLAYDVAFDVLDPASWTTAAAVGKYGPDFSDFEAIIFNNPHYGYGGHKGMVLGIENGKRYEWVFVHTLEYTGDYAGYNVNTHTSNDGTLPDFSTEPATDYDLYDLFERTSGYRGSWWDYKGDYRAIRNTLGFNHFLIRKYITNGLACLRAGGTVELNGSNSYEDWLTGEGFTKAVPWEWAGAEDADHPYYANYVAQHTHPRWHPSWTQFANNAPNPPQLRNMRRYYITK